MYPQIQPDTYSCDFTDIFALGLTIFNIVGIAHPWLATEHSIDHIVPKTEYDLRHGFPVSRAAADVLASTVRFSPSTRPTLASLKLQIRGVRKFYRTHAEIAVSSDRVREYAQRAEVAAAATTAVMPSARGESIGIRSLAKLAQLGRWVKNSRTDLSSTSSNSSFSSSSTSIATSTDVSFSRRPSSSITSVDTQDGIAAIEATTTVISVPSHVCNAKNAADV
jgi:hypothetical protein